MNVHRGALQNPAILEHNEKDKPMTTNSNTKLAATVERIDAFVSYCKEKNHEVVFIDCEGVRHLFVSATLRGGLCVFRYSTSGMVYETQIDEECPVTFSGKKNVVSIKGRDVDDESWAITTKSYLDVRDMMASV